MQLLIQAIVVVLLSLAQSSRGSQSKDSTVTNDAFILKFEKSLQHACKKHGLSKSETLDTVNILIQEFGRWTALNGL